MKKMRAFHKKASTKSEFLKRVQAHQKADEIIKGQYWANGKGCAVGCTLEYSDSSTIHEQYEKQLGIPDALARLEDYLFERMPNDKAMLFPAEFLKAIPVGADLSLIPAKFIHATLKELLNIKEVKDDDAVSLAIVGVMKLWDAVIRGKNPKSAAWNAARNAAWSAADSAAESASESAARNAAASAAESAAWSAAASAAWSAADSAAWSAADSAAESASWSATWSAARSAAESASAYKMSRTLLTLLKKAK